MEVYNEKSDQGKEVNGSYERLEQPFEHEMCEKLTHKLLDDHELQRLEFADNPDMLFKLNVHFPSVYHVAKTIAPDDEVVHLAALYHDYGRVFQYRRNGDFNDRGKGSDEDHHVVGYRHFLEDASSLLERKGVASKIAIEESKSAGLIYRVSQAILLHGLRGKAFEERFASLDPETARVVDIVSQIDDIANGTQCVGYLLREGQEHAKNVSNGGFIPDENEGSRAVSPKVMDLFRASDSFDRNAECKTYPDYYLFGAFLATRSLKNPETREITKEMMSLPITVAQYEQINGERVLTSRKFDSSMDAFKYIFDTQLDEKDAREAFSILSDYFEYGEVREKSESED